MLSLLSDTAYVVFGMAKLWAERLFVPPPPSTPASLAIEAKLEGIHEETLAADEWAIVPGSVTMEPGSPLGDVVDLDAERTKRRVNRQPCDVNGGAACPVVAYDFGSYDAIAD